MSLQNLIDSQQINDCIKEYLIFNKFTNTKECFDAEIKAKQVSNKLTEKKQINFNSSNETIQTPKLYNLVLSEPIQKNQDFDSKHKFETVHRKYLQILEAARQIFSSSINILEFLNKNQEYLTHLQDFEKSLEIFKLTLNRYHTLLIYEGIPKNQNIPTSEIITNKKNNILDCIKNNEFKNITEILLSIRVSALELEAQKRKKLVEILIETDFLNISNDDSISWILESKKQGLRTAGLSIISLIAGCNEGIKYLTRDFYEFNVVDNISKVMQNESYNSVAQRFCLAIIQKMSVYQEISECLFNNKLLDWALKIFREYLISLKDFAFLYNFSSALLLNMIYVLCKEKKELLTSDKAIQLIQNLYVPLFSLAQHYSYTVFNILSIFSYLVNDFSKELEDCEFNVKIKEFLFEYQNNKNIDANTKEFVSSLCSETFFFNNKGEIERGKVQSNKINEKIKSFEGEDMHCEVFPDEIYNDYYN